MYQYPADVIRKQNEIEERKREIYRKFLADHDSFYYGAWCMGKTWADLNRYASPEDVAMATAAFTLAFAVAPHFQEAFKQGFWKGASTILQ